MDDGKQRASVTIRGGIVRGETIELGRGDSPDLICDRAFMHNCVIYMFSTEFSIVDANFLNCQLEVRTNLSNMQFLEAVFERCTFKGAFARCTFGHRRGQSKTPNAYYRDCDFSNATLDMCSFFEGDLGSTVWPTGPSFIVVNPTQNRDDWLTIQFPDELKNWQQVIGEVLLSAPQTDGQMSSGSYGAPRAVTVDLSSFDDFELDSVRTIIRNRSYIKWASPATS